MLLKLGMIDANENEWNYFLLTADWLLLPDWSCCLEFIMPLFETNIMPASRTNSSIL